MSCFHPLHAYMAKEVNENGKRPIVFSHREGYIDIGYDVPCGQCGGCRKDKAKMWAIRCRHEASLYEDNCFVTLTYDKAPFSLVKRDFVLFMKRLRKVFGKGIRYFHVGEYGDKFGRPHHHIIFFGLDFKDRVFLKVSKGGDKLFTSPTLEKLWPFGFSSVGDVSPKSISYCTQYCYKKITGSAAVEHYAGRVPEYTTMSRKPGIGHDWLEKYGDETWRDDNVSVGGSFMKPPKYYDKLLEIANRGLYNKIKNERREKLKCIDRGKSENNRIVKRMKYNINQRIVK